MGIQVNTPLFKNQEIRNLKGRARRPAPPPLKILDNRQLFTGFVGELSVVAPKFTEMRKNFFINDLIDFYNVFLYHCMVWHCNFILPTVTYLIGLYQNESKKKKNEIYPAAIACSYYFYNLYRF